MWDWDVLSSLHLHDERSGDWQRGRRKASEPFWVSRSQESVGELDDFVQMIVSPNCHSEEAESSPTASARFVNALRCSDFLLVLHPPDGAVAVAAGERRGVWAVLTSGEAPPVGLALKTVA